MAVKKLCWALQYRHGLVQDKYDYSKPVHTLLFRTRRHATTWLEDNPYWLKMKAQPVRVKVTISEVY